MSKILSISRHLDVGVWTSALDLGNAAPHQGIELNSWVTANNGVAVFYAEAGKRKLRDFQAAVESFRPSCIYLNGMFSWPCALGPLMLKALGRLKPSVVIAPRGMLKPAALSRRYWKKFPVLAALRSLNVARHVTFHATSGDEANEVRATFGDRSQVHVVTNFPRPPRHEPVKNSRQQGRVRLSFVGRIHPTKNLDFLLRGMRQMSLPCHLDVIGPCEDETYMRKCRELAKEIPQHVKVVFRGALPPNEVETSISQSDLFVLPTYGENFGHAIYEALGLGIPVLISDQTIWRGLALKSAGWELPLMDPLKFTKIIETVAKLRPDEYAALQRGALAYATEHFDHQRLTADYLQMFGAN